MEKVCNRCGKANKPMQPHRVAAYHLKTCKKCAYETRPKRSKSTLRRFGIHGSR